MLTSVHVVTHDDADASMRILTSDRDEKVRISCFPRTFQVEGYLLGHTAFIAAMDVHAPTNTCVTCSGDGTVRLWNYQTCTELASIPPQPATPAPAPTPTQQNPSQSNPHSHKQTHVIIPVNLAISSNASIISVVREGVESVDLYQIDHLDKQQHSSCANLTKLCTVECDSQPLATKFMDDGSLLILKRNHHFLLHCTYDAKDKKYLVSQNSDITNALLKLEEATATDDKNVSLLSNICMPMTVLEKDDFGNYKLTKIAQREKNDKQKQAMMSWNDPNRIIIAKKASSRRKRKKREGQ